MAFVLLLSLSAVADRILLIAVGLKSIFSEGEFACNSYAVGTTLTDAGRGASR